MKLPPFKNGEHNSESVSTLYVGLTALTVNFCLSQFDMICSGKALNTVSKVCFSVGLVFGAALIGILSDRWVSPGYELLGHQGSRIQ